MKSNRSSVTLGYSTKVQTENGVWEDNITEVKVKALLQKIYQNRLIESMKEGTPIVARLVIRSSYLKDNLKETLKYVIYENKIYKADLIQIDNDDHCFVLEVRELI